MKKLTKIIGVLAILSYVPACSPTPSAAQRVRLAFP